MCGADAAYLGDVDGFATFAHGALCDRCVRNVLAAGSAPVRRARTTQARVDVVLAAYPDLIIEERARRRVTIGGSILGRPVRFTFRDSAREGESERFVLRAAFAGERGIDKSDLRLFSSLIERLAPGSPSIATEDFRHVRIAFRHLGRRDTLHAIDGLIASVASLETLP